MQKNLKIFSSDVFGNLRTWDNNGKIMFVASDVAKMLGYSKPANAIATHCRYALKQGIPHPQGKGTLEESVKRRLPVSGCEVYNISLHTYYHLQAGIQQNTIYLKLGKNPDLVSSKTTKHQGNHFLDILCLPLDEDTNKELIRFAKANNITKAEAVRKGIQLLLGKQGVAALTGSNTLQNQNPERDC